MSQYLAFQEAKSRLEKYNDESIRRLLANETIWNNISDSSNVIRQNLLKLLVEKNSQQEISDDIYAFLILLTKYYPRNEFVQNEGLPSGYICNFDNAIIAEPIYTSTGFQYDARNITRLRHSIRLKRDMDYIYEQGVKLNLMAPNKNVDRNRLDTIFLKTFFISSIILIGIFSAILAPLVSGMLLLIIMAAPVISIIGSHFYANYAYNREVYSRTNTLQDKIGSLVEIAARPSEIIQLEVAPEVVAQDDEELEFVADQPGLLNVPDEIEGIPHDEMNDAGEEITGEMDHNEQVQVEVQGEPDHPHLAPQLLRWMNQGERNDPVLEISPRRLSI